MLRPLTSLLSVVCKVKKPAITPVNLRTSLKTRRSEDHSLTPIGGRVVATHLHRRSLHSRHAGQSIEDGDGDWNGNKEAADERPQVAPPRPRLLSHHLDRKQQQQQQQKIFLLG